MNHFINRQNSTLYTFPSWRLFFWGWKTGCKKLEFFCSLNCHFRLNPPISLCFYRNQVTILLRKSDLCNIQVDFQTLSIAFFWQNFPIGMSNDTNTNYWECHFPLNIVVFIIRSYDKILLANPASNVTKKPCYYKFTSFTATKKH